MASSPVLPQLQVLLVLCLIFNLASSDVASDRAECTDQLVGLATCLTYVEGSAKTPTPDCCSGLKQVLAKSPKCLCILVKDRNDPQLGIKINATLALSLPSVCSAPANISNCPKLLNLPENSPEAEIFKQFGNGTQGGAPSASAKGSSTGKHENGGTSNYLGGKRWLGVVGGVWVWSPLLPILVLLS